MRVHQKRKKSIHTHTQTVFECYKGGISQFTKYIHIYIKNEIKNKEKELIIMD